MRAYPRLQRDHQQRSRGWRTYHSLQLSFNRRFRNGVSFGFNDTIGLSDTAAAGAAPAARRRRLVSRSAPIRRRPTSCSATTTRVAHIMQGELRVGSAGPQSSQPALRAVGYVDQRLAALGHLVGRRRDRATGVQRLHRRLQLPERRRQREPDRLARLRRARPHRRRSRQRLQQRPRTGSSTRRRSRARSSAASASSRATTTCTAASRARSTWRSRATSGSAAAGTSSCASTCSTRRTRRSITGRNTTMNLTSPTDPVTITQPAVRSRRVP